MMKLLRWFVQGFCLIWILVGTFEFKTISYDKIPKVGQTFDEYAFAWIGKSFIQSGMPMSWTTNLDIYKKFSRASGTRFAGFGLEIENQRPNWRNALSLPKPAIMITEMDYGIGNRYIGIVQPYFDHPPLAGLVYALGMDKKVDNPLDITAEQFRYANRYLGLLTAVLLFVLASRLFSPWIGLVATGLYSTSPSTLLSSRLTLAENVLTPLILLTLIFINIALEKKTLRWWIAAGIFAGLSMLTKMSGVSVVLAGGYMAWEKRFEFKKWWGFIAASLGVFSFYLGYGTLLNWQLFWNILLTQSGRAGWGIINLYQGVERLFFNGFPIDGWWTGGLVVTLYLAAKSLKNFHLVSTMALAFILTAVLLGGDNNAWYLFPLGALWCLSYAGLIFDLVKNPGLINSTLFLLFGILSSSYWGFFKLRPELSVSWVTRIMAMVFIGGALLTERIAGKSPWVKVLWVCFLIAVLHRLYLWNIRGLQFILANWNKLPYPLMWKN